MSRHDLQPRTDAIGVLRAVVGWDRPLRTFFAQVFAPDDEEGERTVLWEGTGWEEITAASAAIALVSPFALVPDSLEQRLEAEKRDSYDRRDSARQAAMRRSLG